MLACYKARAVPINVNYRYVAEELRYLCDDADLVALFHDADTAEHVDAVDSPGLLLTSIVGLRRVRAARAIGIGGARSRPALARRPLRALHGRHHRPAEGRGVAPGRHVLRRPRQRQSRRAADHRARTDRRRRCSTIPRSDCGRSSRRATPRVTQFVSLALGPLMHASGQWSALGTLLGGGKVVLYGESHVDMEQVLDLLERERVNACNLVGDASARPMLQALRGASRSLGPLRAPPARLGRQHPLGRREGRVDGRAAVGARDRRGNRLVGVARAGGRGHDARRRAVGSRSRSRPRPTRS